MARPPSSSTLKNIVDPHARKALELLTRFVRNVPSSAEVTKIVYNLGSGSGGSGGGSGPAGIDHGSLTGLADNDHPQYLLTSALPDLADHSHAGATIGGDGGDISANYVNLSGIQTITGKKTLQGPIFQDSVTTTKEMLFDLTGLAAATVTKKFLAGSGTLIEKIGTDLSLTGQTATITTTNLLASAPAGFYRATVYVVATASTVGTLTVTLGWTDAQQAQASTVITTGVIAAGGFATAILPMKTSGTNNITYTTVVGGTALTYNLYIVLEQLS